MEISAFELLLSLHICDSGLPAGALAHSNGIESALQSGFILPTKESLTDYVKMILEQIVSQSLPFVDAARTICLKYKAGDSNQLDWIDELCKIDSHIDTVLASNAVACRASIAQGDFDANSICNSILPTFLIISHVSKPRQVFSACCKRSF